MEQEIAKRANQVLQLLVFHSQPDLVDCNHTDDGFWEYRWYFEWDKPFWKSQRIANETLLNMDVSMAALLLLNTI